MSRKRTFCSKRGWCKSMDERLAPICNNRGKGLTVVMVTSVKTGKHRDIGVAYKTGANDRGLMLNVCPWCGENILFVEKDEKAKAAS